jgi:hypothetical protein
MRGQAIRGAVPASKDGSATGMMPGGPAGGRGMQRWERGGSAGEETGLEEIAS